MNEQVMKSLLALFEKYRVIFWYDEKEEMRAEFENLELAGIEKLEIANNEFGIKYRVMKQEPKQKFLLYHEGKKPEYTKDWLLDLRLAQGEIRTDQVAIYQNEIGLDYQFIDIVRTHKVFFDSAKQRQAIKKLLEKQDTRAKIKIKMLAVLVGCEPLFEEIVETLLTEEANGKDTKINRIIRCGLDQFFWEQLERYYGYKSTSPGLKDFAIELFKSCYAMGTEQKHLLTSEALVFLKRWKDSKRHSATFEILSEECGIILNIEKDLQQRDYRELIELDFFKLIEQKILSELVQQVTDSTISRGDGMALIRQRRQSYWYDDFLQLYEAIDYAIQLKYVLSQLDLSSSSIDEGLRNYSVSWYKIDQLYRKFIYHAGESGQQSMLRVLTQHIENLYSNNFLLALNNNWQHSIDKISKWKAEITSQNRFFHYWVEPFLSSNKKVFVIISDAMRFEIGEELMRLIQQEDRYDAKLESMLGMLPSYTQLGMAALLPQQKLEISSEKNGLVFVDDKSSQGIDARNKILSKSINGKGRAIQAKDFMNMNREEYRAIVKENDVVYLYHNLIDSVGDKKDSEERVFKAVEDTLGELIGLIKKLSAANASNIIVTADHGFIYQNRPIEESDFASVEVEGDTIFYRDRRFILGKGLKENNSLTKFSSSDLGLAGDLDIQIPKSINRLRLQGSGSRFVHGGASLQEIVLPVISINKKRKSNISYVDVDVLRSTTNIISSGQLSLAFYQIQPVTNKIQPRLLRAGIYNSKNELISDSHELKFDYVSENSREREMLIRFVLSRKADEVNGQEVYLRLDEKVGKTSHYKEYKSLSFTVRRSFTTDFDF